MTDEHEPPQYLSAEDLRVLKFAARRQLTRWANKRNPSAEQRAQRATLQRVLHILEDDAFADGCDLHAPATRSKVSTRNTRRKQPHGRTAISRFSPDVVPPEIASLD